MAVKFKDSKSDEFEVKVYSLNHSIHLLSQCYHNKVHTPKLKAGVYQESVLSLFYLSLHTVREQQWAGKRHHARHRGGQ